MVDAKTTSNGALWAMFGDDANPEAADWTSGRWPQPLGGVRLSEHGNAIRVKALSTIWIVLI